jgi:hypothetical protein
MNIHQLTYSAMVNERNHINDETIQARYLH